MDETAHEPGAPDSESSREGSAQNTPLCPHTGALLKPLAKHKAIQSKRTHSQARTTIDSYFITEQRDIIYRVDAKPASYGEGYFLEEYQKQYGRSYFEDEPALRVYARRNLNLLEQSGAKIHGGKLFEIGCATGFFLDESRRRGMDVRGADLSPFGIRYAKEMLGLNVEQVGFTESRVEDTFDVVASFFSLEHIVDQKLAFEKISQILNPGGFFILSIPSISGPLFDCHLDQWLETHPEDHMADYSPEGLKRILPLYGLEVVRTRPFSYHPERACGIAGSFLFRPLYRFYANTICYGDTITVVARKKRLQDS